ncbi:MAG: UDP-glucose--hexose-1-phosphate uridylyltransferase, partial [Clostridia bacterium]|nr:UDP-glucose--hexose-1-phosphate uridylyltransferase [Clostridia bacterium]
MSVNVNLRIQQLVEYALRQKLISEEDRVYITNSLLAALNLAECQSEPAVEEAPLEEILSELCDYAAEQGLIESNSVVYRDLFDTKLMGILTPRPSEVIRSFSALYALSPKAATDYFYKLCRASDYIRTYRVAKDMKWTYTGEFGELDITINLSKPEKDPKAIAAAKLLPQRGYPKCLLCAENEGYAGNAGHPARQTLRLIPTTMAGKKWYMQYSPYVYYNEHCIVLSAEHSPMKIEKNTFVRLLDFVGQFPHYFLGSNADLPIVGGSILSHDHMQGGHYTFAMAKAPIETEIKFSCYEDVEAGIVKWPMSVIRLRGSNKQSLVSLADKILTAWRGYSDPEAFIFANTDGEAHNTITPIARMRDGKYELDLVLRNNITTEEHPLGVYHPHADVHNIKKENIGLIEVMGLAVLPARLKEEIAVMREFIIAGRDFSEDERIAKHADWFARFRVNYTFIGWNTERDGSGKAYAAGDVIALTAKNNTEILYAQWKENPKYDYTLIYNANFGDNETKADAENVKGIYALSYSMKADANSFRRPNYTFTGWNTKADGTGDFYAAGNEVALTAVDNWKVLYAQWVENPKYNYTVTYDANFGENATKSDAENVVGVYAISYKISV